MEDAEANLRRSILANLDEVDRATGDKALSDGIINFNFGSVSHLTQGSSITLKEGAIISFNGKFYRVKSAMETKIILPFGRGGFSQEQAGVEMFGDNPAWITSDCVQGHNR
jgi:hypothetical protein